MIMLIQEVHAISGLLYGCLCCGSPVMLSQHIGDGWLYSRQIESVLRYYETV